MLHLISKRGFLFIYILLLAIASQPVLADETISPENKLIIEEQTIKENAEDSLVNEQEVEDFDEDEIYPFEMGNGDDIDDESETEDSFFSFLDTPQAYLSSGVEGMAKRIDQFFVEDEIFYESSGSYLRLIYSKI